MLVPQLTAFAMAAVRMLPGINRINTYLSEIAYAQPCLRDNKCHSQKDGHNKKAQQRTCQHKYNAQGNCHNDLRDHLYHHKNQLKSVGDIAVRQPKNGGNVRTQIVLPDDPVEDRQVADPVNLRIERCEGAAQRGIFCAQLL